MVSSFKEKISHIPTKKPKSLEAAENLNPNLAKNIFNYFNFILTNRKTFLLSFSPDFALPDFKLDYYKHVLAFEKLCTTLYHCQVMPNKQFSEITNKIKTNGKNSFNSIIRTFFSLIFKPIDPDILKNLARRENLVISKPDKGRRVVLLNKAHCIAKMERIIWDASKFKQLGVPPFKYTLKHEDKSNRHLRKLLNTEIISKEQYE